MPIPKDLKDGLLHNLTTMMKLSDSILAECGRKKELSKGEMHAMLVAATCAQNVILSSFAQALVVAMEEELIIGAVQMPKMVKPS